MSKKNAALNLQVASAFHEDWRVGYQAGLKKAGKPATTPRFKPTTDATWFAANTGESFCTVEDGENKVNIDIDFELLPSDWQADNAQAAEFVVPKLVAALSAGVDITTSKFIENLASEIHEAWIARQRAKGITEANDSYFAGLAVPYSQLPEEEKAKDRNQVLIATPIVKAAA